MNPDPGRRDLLILICGACILFTVALGWRDLWNPNEPIYGRAAVEMSERGDWLIPTVNGTVFAEKPILYYWMALTASKITGNVDEFTLRLPSVAAGLLSIVLTYFLVLPYTGRRRALISGLLLGSMFSVFWCSRSIQMDILVLASTVGTLLPLSRMADHGMSQYRGWLWAGLAAGLGFLAKGPVALILPGLAIFGYALVTRRPRLLFDIRMWPGILLFLAVGGSWYYVLLAGGYTDVIDEVLIRQNFSRFVAAWDHNRPWHYYLGYFWQDFAPWSWFVPLAAFLPCRNDDGWQLRKLSWVWIIGVILFFSFSESKRSPYVLPVAPAVAILAADVIHRLVTGRLSSRLRIAALSTHALLAFLCTSGGLALIFVVPSRYPEFQSPALAVIVVLLAGSAALVAGIVLSKTRRALASSALGGLIAAIYLIGGIWLLPLANQFKSARSVGEILKMEAASGSDIVSYGLWAWRAEYSFYGEQNIRVINDRSELKRYWGGIPPRLVLVEDGEFEEVRQTLGQDPAIQKKIGGRTVYLFSNHILAE
jgi:4-amino-4-deoxy-L-arabinose transferase-like glycosyltransferase